MHKHNTFKVFTPTQPAIDTFIERSSKVNNHLVDSLDTPGKQIVIFGHSGCGKTTLIRNKLNQKYENSIFSRCMKGMTFESLVLDAFDQLSSFFTKETKTREFSIAPQVSISYSDIKTSIKGFNYKNVKKTSQKEFLPPQLTPQNLAKFFGELKACWVLEDFHKIKGTEKTKVSQIMKVFMDMSVDYPELKLITIGAVGTARQVVEYDNEMDNRVSEIHVPYMLDSEIKSIITKGEELLNIKIKSAIADKIVKYSCGLPSICHQLCLNLCTNKEVYETQPKQVYFGDPDFEKAIVKFIEEKTDSFKSAYDKAIKVKNKSAHNVPKEILKAALKINKDEFSFDDIRYNIKYRDIPNNEIEKKLNQLCSPERGEVFAYDENSNLYRYNNLFLKNYALLQFRDEKSMGDVFSTRKDQKVINRLLEIIEGDISDEYTIFIEDLY